MKDPKPLFQKQQPRQKIKFSPSFPLMKAKDVFQLSQIKSVKSQADIHQAKEVESSLKVLSNSSHLESRTPSELKQLSKPI